MSNSLSADIERVWKENGFAATSIKLTEDSAISLCNALDLLGTNDDSIEIRAGNRDSVSISACSDRAWIQFRGKKATDVCLDALGREAVVGFLRRYARERNRSVDHIDIEVYHDKAGKNLPTPAYITFKLIGSLTKVDASILEKRLFG